MATLTCLAACGASQAAEPPQRPAAHDADCRLAIDLGSSGLRAGQGRIDATQPPILHRVDLDALALVNGPDGVRGLGQKVGNLLKDLLGDQRGDQVLADAHKPCRERVAVGFSAWRLAQQKDPIGLRDALKALHERTGLTVLIVPAEQEGRYGHTAAAATLGARLRTPYVLDVGGGSLQVNGAAGSFGVPLGQKAWQQLACAALGRPHPVPTTPTTASPTGCALQPLTPTERERLRALAASRLQGLSDQLPPPRAMTAFTRPVTLGVAPAVQRLLGLPDAGVLSLADLARVIDTWSGQDSAHLADAAGLPPAHAAYLLSDMLLLEAVTRAAGLAQIDVAAADVSNVPAILQDDRAYAWARHPICYLRRLPTQGEAAYLGDPASCPPER
ncbi:hypothetical protein [Aquabacterium sp.]|uniref:hypothetical protein n=1 Tax=Aquabacterium sp. TaxID=1872578 RepID=UPI0025BB7F88|nr:hypothetical protein [Aquabacterium sp.]